MRLALPPLVVLLAGWAQHRLGPRLSGSLVGLPLTSGPFLLALLHAQGPGAAAHAAGGVVTGQLVVVTAAIGYAWAAAGRAPAAALARTVPAAAGIALLARLLTSPAFALAIAVGVVLVALLRWRPAPDPVRPEDRTGAPPGGRPARELAVRATVAGGLVASLTLAAPFLGAHLAGLLAAVPLVIGVMAPSTHARSGLAGVRSMLRGVLAVVPGSGAFAAVLAACLGVVPAGVAFGVAVTTLMAVNALVARLDAAGWRNR